MLFKAFFGENTEETKLLCVQLFHILLNLLFAYDSQ